MTSKEHRREYMRRYRAAGRDIDSRLARQWADARASTWVRVNHPEVWEALMEEGYRATGGKRKPPGYHRGQD